MQPWNPSVDFQNTKSIKNCFFFIMLHKFDTVIKNHKFLKTIKPKSKREYMKKIEVKTLVHLRGRKRSAWTVFFTVCFDLFIRFVFLFLLLLLKIKNNLLEKIRLKLPHFKQTARNFPAKTISVYLGPILNHRLVCSFFFFWSDCLSRSLHLKF